MRITLKTFIGWGKYRARSLRRGGQEVIEVLQSVQLAARSDSEASLQMMLKCCELEHDYYYKSDFHELY